MNTKLQTRLIALVLVVALSMMFGCGSTPEEKRQKFINKGNKLLNEEKFTQATIEFRNAIQADPEYPESYFLAGQALVKQGKLQDAYTYFTKAVEKKPEYIDANLKLGKLLLVAKEFVKAQERVDLVIRKEPDNQQALLLQGGLLLAEHKADDAKAVLEKLLPRNIQDIDLYLLLASAYNQLGDLAATESVLKKGLTTNPQSVPILITLANLYLGQNQETKVEEVLKQIIVLEPGQPEHVERYAGYLWYVGRKNEADRLLQELLNNKDANEESWARIAAFYLSRKAVDKGQQVLKDGLQKFNKSFQIRLLLKDSYLAEGKLAKAMNILLECLKLNENNPGYVVAQRNVADLALRLGNIAQAETALAVVLKKSPNDVDGHMLKGSMLMLKGELDQAIAEYRSVLQARPNDTDATIKLAEAMVRNHQKNLAIDLLKQGLQVNPNTTEFNQALIKIYLLDNKKKEAEDLLRKMADSQPNDLMAQVALADFYAANGNQGKAVQAYKGIIAKAHDNPLGYIKLSSLFAANKQSQEATTAAISGVTAFPDSPLMVEHAVRLMMQLGQPDEVLSLLSKRLRNHPDDLLGLILQGEVYTAKKEYGLAEANFRKAMELNGNIPEFGSRLARVLTLSGKAENAIRDSEQMLAGSGASLGQWVLLAELYKQMNHPDQASALYERAVKQYPSSWFLLNNMAYDLANKATPSTQELTRAEDLVQQAQLLVPGNPAVLDTAGWLAYKKMNLPQAQVWLSMALGSNPNDPVTNYHLAMVLLKNGKKEDAKSLFEKVVQATGKSPEQEDAKKMLQGMTM